MSPFEWQADLAASVAQCPVIANKQTFEHFATDPHQFAGFSSACLARIALARAAISFASAPRPVSRNRAA